MDVIDVGDEENSDLPPPPPLGHLPPRTPKDPIDPMRYIEAAPSSGGSPSKYAWSEEGSPDQRLDEELFRRLDTIDIKLDWLIGRAKVTRRSNTSRIGGAFTVGGTPDSSFTVGGIPDSSSRQHTGSSFAVTEADKMTMLRSIADGGHAEPPAVIVPSLAPASAGRGSIGVDRATRERGSAGDGARLACRTSGFDTSRKGSTQNNGGLLTPHLNGRPGREGLGQSNASIPAVFESQFVARRLYEKSKNKDLDQMQKRIRSLPKAMRNRRSATVDYIYTALDDPSSSKVAWWTAACLDALVLLSVLGTFLQTIEDPVLNGWSAAIVETVFDVVFLTEVSLRWGCAPNRVNLVFVFQSWIDILAASAIAVRAAVGWVLPEHQDDPGSIYLLCFVPVIRLLKIIRHFETFYVLIQAAKVTMEALPMLLYAMALITMTFAALMYSVEPDMFESPYRAVWFCLATITRVGYGDYAPNTPAGITVAMVLIVFGILVVAVLIAVIGVAFHEVWQTRDYLLLLRKTRSKLHQWGYTAHDIPKLFKLVDFDEEGVLELDEFCELVKEMKIGLSEPRVVALFEHMDKYSIGALNAAEFVLEVFPEAFVEAIGHAEVTQDAGQSFNSKSSFTAGEF